MATTPAEAQLERLLLAAASDPAERPAFTRALLDSDVYVLGYVEGDVSTTGVAGAGSSMRILAIGDEVGPITPFFTSEAAVQQLVAARPGTDPRFVRFGCRALFDMTSGSRLVLNPGSPYGKIFEPNEVDALITGREPGLQREVLAAARQVLVGQAAHVPAELPAVLSRFLVQRPVEAAHLGWIGHPDGHTGFLLVVLADDGEAAMQGFGSVAIGEVTNGETLDVMVAPTGSTTHLLADVPAFYQRQPQRDVPTPADPTRRRWGRR